MRTASVLVFLAACSTKSSPSQPTDATSGADAAPVADAPAVVATGLGVVSGVHDLAACPQGAPAGSSCRQLSVTGCPGIETEALDATIAILPATGTRRGTVVHFSGGGGETISATGTPEYQAAGLLQVYVAWSNTQDLHDWEQTASAGIKTAACRPATVLRWIFDEPTLHGGSRTTAFCGEGHSGGSAQLGYAIAHYGLADYLDYVNEISGPPFARLDLGCDGDAPQTALVCGDTVRTDLPPSVARWENIAAPLTCGSHDVPAAELARWKADSIAIGGAYAYPKTDVEFFDCTNNATAVTAMSQVFYQTIAAASGNDPARAGYHCYSAADGCQGEGLGSGGAAAATAALVAGCVPRH
ncbi:MAG: hypothetical protein ABI678_09470 [Kofleriaceae bacterium]